MIVSSVASARQNRGASAFAEYEDAVGDGEQFGKLAGGHDDRHALGRETSDQRVNLRLRADVDAARGFVEQQDFRVGQEPAREDALLLIPPERLVTAAPAPAVLIASCRVRSAIADASRAGLTSPPGQEKRSSAAIVMFSPTVIALNRPSVFRSSVTSARPAAMAAPGEANGRVDRRA